MDPSGNRKGARGCAGNRGIIHQPFLGLLVAVMRMTVQRGITHWYAGMEQALHIRLASFGLKLTPIGPPVEYPSSRIALPGCRFANSAISAAACSIDSVWSRGRPSRPGNR